MPFAQSIDLRAEKRLQSVADQFKTALGTDITAARQTGLRLELALKNQDYIHELELEYDLQNRFFSRIYDLTIKCNLPFDYGEETRVTLKYRGFNSIKGAYFVDESGSAMGERIVAKLNSPRVLKKFIEFQFLGLNLEYHALKKTWSIEAKSIVGSSTWMFLPPLIHTIKPKPEECRRIVALFELLAFVVSTEGTDSPH